MGSARVYPINFPRFETIKIPKWKKNIEIFISGKLNATINSHLSECFQQISLIDFPLNQQNHEEECFPVNGASYLNRENLRKNLY